MECCELAPRRTDGSIANQVLQVRRERRRPFAKLWRSVRRQHISGTAGQMVEQAAYYTPGWMQLSITIL